MKYRVILVDHSYREKTHAIDFLKELLHIDFQIVELYDKSWMEQQGVTENEINAIDADAIIFFQILPPVETMSLLNCKNIIWFPMYDAECNKLLSAYLPYKKFGLKIITFSSSLYSKFCKLGFDTTNYKYQLKPRPRTQKTQGLSIFYWVRTNDITWNFLKNLVKNEHVERLILRVQMDPGYTFVEPTIEEMNKYSITILKEWLDHEDYLSLVSTSSLFIAPRKREGIGLSFIEALACGTPVLAIDDATMNEYVIEGKNGYLLDQFHPRTIDFSYIQQMEPTVRNIAQADYTNWEQTKFGIIKDVIRPEKSLRYRYYRNIIYRLEDIITLVKRKFVGKSNWLTFYD